MTGSPALQVRGLTVRLSGRTVLDLVDLDLDPGEWVAVVGPNGAGKSTLLRTLAGLLAPAGGEVAIDGLPLATMGLRDRARRLGSVRQLPEVPPGMTVRDYVLLGRTPHLAPLQREGRDDRRIVAEVLAMLELLGFADRLLSTMSGGELQRVFLARALAQQPRILLLDEPTSALDLGRQQEVLELLDGLRHRLGLSVLATMHDLTLAAQFGDRLVLLDRGRVLADGPPGTVLSDDLIDRVYRARTAVLPPGSVPGLAGPAVIGLRPGGAGARHDPPGGVG